ncbi:hypothetical protein GYMLUDRAFT_942487 [Collybiopsis luxurians FD-317 M1]|uniref:Uncharacterized protein n=1 Tax=Collybiopsis luxurians FD-317 M1 TaxID=944289 RepID=A0A0D0BEW3_9AGAR|nr:hypothetical protein GYMLUDRAFT_942487 [Collybiopsis luxurians FD-317 M1]
MHMYLTRLLPVLQTRRTTPHCMFIISCLCSLPTPILSGGGETSIPFSSSTFCSDNGWLCLSSFFCMTGMIIHSVSEVFVSVRDRIGEISI